MWVLRRFKILILACTLLLIVLTVVYQTTNVPQMVYLFTMGSGETPLSIHCNLGRLGNQMCSYATLYGISALNHRKRIVVLSCNAKYLQGIFKGPSKAPIINPYFYIKSNPWKLKPYLKSEDSAIPPDSNLLEGYYHPCSYTFFDHVRDEIRREFQFEDHYVLHAQSVLQKSNTLGKHNVTYVGLHVRRGDYNTWLNAYDGVPVNLEYFRKAIQYFRDKYSNVIFIAVSEDRAWCLDNLSQFGVYVPDEAPSPAHDLALLSSCNHTILSYGTFGFWGAYLAGGEVLYYDQFLRPNTNFAKEIFVFQKMYPPEWKGIVTVNATLYFQENNRTTNEPHFTVPVPKV